MTAVAVEVELSAARLRQFLGSGVVRKNTEPQRGAIAGSIAPDGSAHYVYGEITGYYLHWLASLDAPDIQARASAEAALQWLQTYLHHDMPLTRIYLGTAPDDWRNKALFAFDFAMIAAGLARAAERKLILLPEPLIARMQHWLQRFVAVTQLRACIATDASVALPVRWSTSGGSFTAKTASRILLFARHTPLDARLRDAACTTLMRVAQAADTNDVDVLHPTLYALEGCLLCPDADPEKLARWFARIVALRAPDGTLPESTQSPEVRRSDIIAQALRVAVFLERMLGRPGHYHEARVAFAAALCARIDTAGRIAFVPKNPDANTWCAMFAEQALRLHSAALREQELPFAVEELV